MPNSPTNSASNVSPNQKPNSTSFKFKLNSLCSSVFCMGRCSKTTDAAAPAEPTTPRSSRSTRLSKCSSSMSRLQDYPMSPSTSSADQSIGRSKSKSSNLGSTDSINRASSRSSLSSKTSLSSIRESLPDNPNIYNFSEICAATNNLLAKRFSSSTAAWRCSLHGKDAIVFQRRLRRSMEASMLRERLSLICRSHHASLIKLLGASISGDHIYLVYEYVTGASLEDCLRNSKNPNFTVLSNWMSRMQVAIDIAQGLDYIHNSFGCNQNFVHNHVRSSGIIITDQPSIHAKICHYGTAELCGEIPDYLHQIQEQEENFGKIEIADNRSIRFEGTRGYMSPEFLATGVGTKKSDVFAFGVVLLELLSGEEPYKYSLDSERKDYRRISLIETAREAMGEKKTTTTGKDEEDACGRTGWLRKWVDRRLKDSFPVEIAEKMTRVALDCVDVDPGRRPNMRDVAGKISKLYLKSERWSNSMTGLPAGITVSLGPR